MFPGPFTTFGFTLKLGEDLSEKSSDLGTVSNEFTTLFLYIIS